MNIQSYFDSRSIFDIADQLPVGNFRHIRVINSPVYPPNYNKNNDFYFDIYKLQAGNLYWRIIAHDVRSNKTFSICKLNGTIQEWTEYIQDIKQYNATLLNGWTAPFSDNNLITYKIGNLYMLSGIIRSPSVITEDTYNVANLNLPFNFTGQGCVNMAVQTDDKLYLTSYNDGILHDQYRQTIPNTEYMIKGFFIH